MRPAADRESPILTEEVADGGAASSALFGEYRIPVALVGTSYSMRTNVHGFLQQALGARVLNAAKDGSGFLQSAEVYFSNPAFRETPPQVVVWEVPERFLPGPV